MRPADLLPVGDPGDVEPGPHDLVHGRPQPVERLPHGGERAHGLVVRPALDRGAA